MSLANWGAQRVQIAKAGSRKCTRCTLKVDTVNLCRYLKEEETSMTRHFVLITGATGGLGRSLARALAATGTSLVLGGRRPDAVRALCAELSERFGIETRPFVADLADLAAVDAALGAVGDLTFSGLVLNAGLTTRKDARTKDGFELTFGVNVLAHQRVLMGLKDRVEEGGRIVVLSSGVHEPDNQLARRAGIPVPRWVGTRDLALPDQATAGQQLDVGPLRYSTSKLANVLQARALQVHLREANRRIDVFAVDPGLMVDTDLARELPWALRPLFRTLGYILTPFVANMRLSTTTAGYLVSLLQDPRWKGAGFQYFDGIHPKNPSEDALRDDYMHEFWNTSAELLNA